MLFWMITVLHLFLYDICEWKNELSNLLSEAEIYVSLKHDDN